MKHLGIATRVLLLGALFVAACTTPTAEPTPTSTPVPTPTPGPRWTEEEVRFPFGTAELFGILSLPAGPPPHPAVVLITGAADTTTRVRGGVAASYHIETASKLVSAGYAVLRYDPPGVGRSSGPVGFENLDLRTAEAMAALCYVQSRPDIRRDRVGL